MLRMKKTSSSSNGAALGRVRTEHAVRPAGHADHRADRARRPRGRASPAPPSKRGLGVEVGGDDGSVGREGEAGQARRSARTCDRAEQHGVPAGAGRDLDHVRRRHRGASPRPAGRRARRRGASPPMSSSSCSSSTSSANRPRSATIACWRSRWRNSSSAVRVSWTSTQTPAYPRNVPVPAVPRARRCRPSSGTRRRGRRRRYSTDEALASRVERVTEDVEAAVEVLGVDRGRPALALLVVAREAREVGPRVVAPGVGAVVGAGPEQHRDPVRGRREARVRERPDGGASDPAASSAPPARDRWNPRPGRYTHFRVPATSFPENCGWL